ncbi:hypothetical protein JZU68_06350, partial [bacterium]|nr:hypothetical protein [bacterium]
GEFPSRPAVFPIGMRQSYSLHELSRKTRKRHKLISSFTHPFFSESFSQLYHKKHPGFLDLKKCLGGETVIN